MVETEVTAHLREGGVLALFPEGEKLTPDARQPSRKPNVTSAGAINAAPNDGLLSFRYGAFKQALSWTQIQTETQPIISTEIWLTLTLTHSNLPRTEILKSWHQALERDAVLWSFVTVGHEASAHPNPDT